MGPEEQETEVVQQLRARARRAPATWGVVGAVVGAVGSVLAGVALGLQEAAHKRLLLLAMALLGTGAGLALGRARALALRVKAEQLSALARLGSRGYFVAGLVTSLVMFGRGCEANALCFDETDCDAPGGSGVFCGGKECPLDPCAKPGSIRCDEGEVECSAVARDDVNDENLCTVDACDPVTGDITHTPLTEEDLDDGIPCTIDQCSPVLGVIHVDDCP